MGVPKLKFAFLQLLNKKNGGVCPKMAQKPQKINKKKIDPTEKMFWVF